MTDEVAPRRDRRWMVLWLLGVIALVYAMVILGGITRLTGSGLSMVDWRPVMGAIPPLGDLAWQEAFDAYKRFPEYQQVNRNMDLDGFKQIFWFEYLHRLLGRSIGLAFFVPFLVFIVRRSVPARLSLRLIVLFLLGGLQGLVGWWMVKSGLVDRPDVSHYRLTVHLALAFVIEAALVWALLGLWRDEPSAHGRQRGLVALAALVAVLAGVTVVSGGLVAGLNAGFMLNTFPLMAGKLVPDGLIVVSPWWMNALDNHVMVQFDHRVLALLTLAAVCTLAWRARRLQGPARRAVGVLLAVALVQVALGITTLLTVVWTPAASAHQGGALALVIASVVVLHHLCYRGAGAHAPAAGGCEGPSPDTATG